MAISVVGKGATGSTAANTLAISPAATVGNYLACFVETATENVKPTSVTDDQGGTWTIEATSGEATSASVQVWFAWKKATGNEKEIKVTPAGSSVVHGIIYLEASGVAAEAPEHLLTTGKQASATTHASPEITTTTANDLIFVGFGWGVTAAELESWNNAMTNISAAASRVGGGYFVVSGTLAAKVFTATLKAAKAGGGVAVALKPAAEGEHAERTAADTITVSEAVTRAAADPRATADTIVVTESSARVAGLPRAVADTVSVSEAVTRTAAHPRTSADTVTISEATTSSVTKLRTTGDTVSISESASRSAQTFARLAADTVTVAEAVVRLGAHPRTLADALTVTESATRALSAPRSAGDAVTVAEGAVRAAQTLSRTAGDTIVVSMTVTGVAHEVATLVIATPLPGWVAVGQRGRIATRRGRVATRNVGRAEI